MNRKRVILAALLGILALCLLYAYVATPRLKKAPPRAVGQRVRVDAKIAKETQSKGVQERINFEFLSVEPQEFPGAQRDIFRFSKKSAFRIEAPAVTFNTIPAPVLNVAVMPEALPFAAVQKSLGQFTFLGFLEKAGEKTVFLSSRGNLFLAKRGENFGVDQEFLIVDIDNDLLKVRHAGRNDLLEIPLIEQQKLNASVSAPAKMPSLEMPPTPANTRIFKLDQRVLRPTAPTENDVPFPEMIDENNPKEEQGAEPPPEGAVLEGETNGSNQ